MIVSFSGMDGAGKTTQIGLLATVLGAQGCAARIVWSRGGYTPGFELLKRIARKFLGRTLPPPGKSQRRAKIFSKPFVSRIWLTLAILDLIILYGIVLRAYSMFGKMVICDRYLDDTRLDFQINFFYIEFEKMWVWKLLLLVSPRPDISFLLLLPVDISMARALIKDEPFPDDEETLKRRYKLYFDEALFSFDKYIRLDGEKEIEAVESAIQAEVLSELELAK